MKIGDWYVHTQKEPNRTSMLKITQLPHKVGRDMRINYKWLMIEVGRRDGILTYKPFDAFWMGDDDSDISPATPRDFHRAIRRVFGCTDFEWNVR